MTPGTDDSVRMFLQVVLGADPEHHLDAYQILEGGDGCLQVGDDATPPPADDQFDIDVAGPVVFDTWAENAEGAVYVVLYPVPEHRLAVFDDWFAEEHVPLLLTDRGWLRSRLFAPDAGDFSRVAVHYLANPRAMDADERVLSLRTPRSDEALQGDWSPRVREFVALSGK